MKKKGLLSQFAIFIAASLITLQTNATVLRVNNNLNYIKPPSGVGVCSFCYQDLSSAVSAASTTAVDTIHIEGSPNWYQGLAIAKKVVIIGPGYFIGGTNSNLNLQYNNDVATIFDLQFNPGSQGSQVFGITSNSLGGNQLKINTDSIRIERCRLVTGLHIISSINHSTIRQNFIDGGINVYTASQNLIIENNYVYGVIIPTGSTGILNQNIISTNSGTALNIYSPFVATNNIVSVAAQNQNTTANIYNNIFKNSVPAWASATNYQVAAGNIFNSGGSTDGNYHVQITCNICLTGSTTGGEIGIFGGNAPYVLSGIANIPTIYNLIAQPNVIQGNTTPAQISTRSNNKN